MPLVRGTDARSGNVATGVRNLTMSCVNEGPGTGTFGCYRQPDVLGTCERDGSTTNTDTGLVRCVAN